MKKHNATVQIDNDIGMLLLLSLLVNAVIGFVDYKLYQASKRNDDAKKDRSIKKAVQIRDTMKTVF